MNTQYCLTLMSHLFSRSAFGRICGLLVLWSFGALLAHAQIVIGGDVYGGGLNGAVGSTERNTETATTVEVAGQTGNVSVRTVFGGGKNGEVHGNTKVDINGGTIGAKALEGTPYGGVYGGGEGADATVTGSTNVTISGGDNFNNVYGGGKQALLTGNAHVFLKSGIVRNNVFGGACMANIEGYALVDIKGGSANQLLVKAVYGGNDISGSILNNIDDNKPTGYNFRVTEGLPTKLESFVFAQATATNAFIGNVFGGGNGDYAYGGSDGNWSVTMNDPEATTDEKTITFAGLSNLPVAPHAYLQIEGGTYGSIYGGGNKATISEKTDIYFGIGMNEENYADVEPMNNIPAEALSWLDLYEGYTLNDGGGTFKMNYNAFRIFGGNNIADMAIRPTWHLKSGMVGNIYSGGNQGRMTYEKGLFLPLTSNHIKVNNVYGGCRMADVNPGLNDGGGSIAGETITYHRFKHADSDDKFAESYNATYNFAEGYAARVLVLAGQINNLYGGNDISGKVYHGTNVELRGAISGDVYGGGNGSYAYTDNADWKEAHPEDADFYYAPGGNSLQALYNKRPHVEKTLLHITGIDAAAPPVYVTGGVYCGGNSATLDGDQSKLTAKFMIGQNVIINGVFLGSNGENMVKEEVLKKYYNDDFSSLKLKSEDQFAEYMKGVSVNLIPEIEWEWDDNDNTLQPGESGINSYIGSFYCGGNVGSMTTPHQMVMNFPRCLTVFDRIVGGCNAANIPEGDYNVALKGGVTNAFTNGSAQEDGKAKVVLNVDARLEPRALTPEFNQYGFITGKPGFVINKENYTYDAKTDYSILKGANVYGGCYTSGYINGDVEININRDLVSPDIPEDLKLNNPEFLADAGITEAPFAHYVFSKAMNIFGGGYGAQTEIRGKSTINLDKNARVMKVFGGGEQGVVLNGATINLKPTLKKPANGDCNVYMVYGGGYEGAMGRQGNVEADIRVLLHGGRIYDAYGGSCNADIYGGTYVEVGDGGSGKLQVMNSVFGANDFGGSLLKSRPWDLGEEKSVSSLTHVKYLSGAVENEIYGGSFGSYDYKKFTEDDNPGFNFPMQDSEPEGTGKIKANTFVQVASQSTNSADYVKGAIYGGGRGYANASGIVDVKQSYVHLAASPIRTTALVPTVFGGGYYSYVENTLVNAYSGKVGTIYGGTAGMSAEELAPKISYNAGITVVNLHSMVNPNMNVFGAGALAGAATTHVNLYGGQAANIYGGSFEEGICQTTNVNVPENSTVAVKSLYGGSKGKRASLPCDVETANIIVKSDQAYVSDTIFGGNHAYRAVEKTNIDIQVPVRMEPGGTLVNVYGGGNGSATITGSTHVKLSGNAQLLDVYGGGKSGKVVDSYAGGALTDRVKAYYASLSSLSSNSRYLGNPTWGDGAYEHNTHVELLGGELRNVYAGGYAGDVEGDTYLEIGGEALDAPTHAIGNPTIRRSAYGGGEMAKVTGTAKVDMWNGYVGYYYDDAAADKYVKELDLRKEGDNLLKENGNLYGAGYGEGAVVMTTQVNLYDGVIRNGLYGGGEIAAVGVGATKLENEKYVLDTSKPFIAGKTNVYMYGGTVEGDVFGGGRGFSYDLTGNEVTGKLYYTDGYVFGGTNVEIYRGTIGTDASLEEGHGNVFGGGNIGYVYGGTGPSRSLLYTGETDATNAKFNGHYYKDNNYTTRSEDCRVHIEARCKVLEAVTIGGKTYAAGEYVPVEKLNTLSATAREWDNLDSEGITIRNAVFAGGNVSSGSDKIYANAVTIYGNATASVVDVFAKDFISVGGDGVGGLYGDGNLTFVDGYRELNITNYGTDFYNLDADLTYAEYLLLSDREKGFYNLLYSPNGIKEKEISFEFEGVRYFYRAQQGESAADEIDEHEFKTMLNAYIQKHALEMAGQWTSTSVDGTAKYTPTTTLEFSLGGSTYTYTANTSYSAAEYDEMMANYKLYIKQVMEAKWDINGECSLTAGRMLNTIQRADFCGMFGSRIMLYGAQDRVPEIVDYTKYTINRVGEVSLNQRKAAYNNTEIHGNYFGIYNVVNLLGALTSDVKFTDIREDVGILEEGLKADGKRYIQYKYDKLSTDPRARNMASSKNMVAQASGVFLELVKEVDDDGNKTYGPVTGVIQLDLINVKPGEGGGYVYAKNEHRAPTALPSNIIARQVLSRDNQGAVSYANFVYDGALQAMQTSGNFVHPTKRIVDECFPRGGYYDPTEENYSNAHFWYIRGDFYVYDQYVSGYTGAAQAYEQDIEIPLTIAAGSEGRMTLQSVNPSKYAYFVGKHYGDKVLTANDNILVEDKTYYLNDPISYWDWSQLSITDQAYFVDETYVAICDAKIAGTEYQKGHVLLPADYESLVTASGNVAYIKDINGNYQEDNDAYKETTKNVFRISNEISHDAGYLLTFDISNPLEWDNYYTQLNKGDGNIVKMLESEYKAKLEAGTINAQDYTIAPTLLCTQSGIYGQREYAMDDLVNEAVYNSQKGIAESSNSNIQSAYNAIKKNQAQFSPAYVVTADELSFTHADKDYHMFVGSYISKDLYEALDESLKKTSNFEPAYICINTIEVADKEYVLNGQLIPASRYEVLKGQAQDNANTFMYGKADKDGKLSRYFSPAYVCTKDGKYGGSYFEEKKNYRALDFCGLSRDERNAENVFTYNFDAFDLLATDFDPDIRKYQEPYWNTQAVNYTATYSGAGSYTLFMRKGASDTYDGSLEEVTINNGTTYQRAEYEQILNEKSHYMPIKVDDVNVAHYVVKETFEKANVYYPVGKVISEEEYDKLSDLLKGKVEVFPANTFNSTGTYYYCTEKYNMSDQSSPITNCIGGGTTTYSGKGTTVPAGIVISYEGYKSLPNYQNGFIIQGHAPIQTTTIYVPRESDINNLSKDRVITVVYRYDYKEGEGTSITHHSEKHIINIHLEFRSGQPTIGDVTPPATVLPNSVVGLSVPSVKRGAYEILGGGWEIFETPEDAYEHKNGVEYKNNATPMYWYQNNYYVAYYAKTYLGKAYSNPVPFSVANYHRMGEVMHHPKRMFIDHKDVDRASKIYLDAADYDANSIAAGEKEENDLDFLYDLYKETNAGKAGDYMFNQRITNAANLDFILRSDIAPKKYTDWQQPGADGNCFAGNFHGNGHTVSGLNKSLFHNLCGTVYNTGVTGFFTGGGVADNGGTAVNCWVKTSGTPTTYAVIGNAAKDASDVQVINSYYYYDSANDFKAGGMATPRPEADFVKGHVAYDLNRYYLEARRGVKDVNEDKKFMFYMRQPNGQLEMADGTGAPELWTSYYHTDNVLDKYVEDNIKTGDFIYAKGEIPLEADVRMKKESGVHYPIYPDDYLFFGQSLNYTPSHDNVPEALIKNEDNLVVHNNETANRVYRAPAYRRSSSLNQVNPAVYFNRHAAFAGTYNSKSVDADLTAIDFTGASEKETDDVKTAVVYTPLLDYEGLKSFDVTGITQNLLVYADAGDVASHDVLSASLLEPTYKANTEGWNEVDIVSAQNVKGHLVEKGDEGYISTRNHFLVDKQDFNAPLAYTFDNNHFMWYQRTPEVFIDGTGGWEGLCLPFTAKMVSAHQKGEITHFYGNDNKAHEYWLRAPKEVQTKDENTHMIFACPKTGETGEYEVGNAFLYNYYYSNVDDNGDSYWNSEFNQSPNGNRESDNHGNYYASPREYENYAYLTANVPYIIGFPGVRYYEFDMSGQFAPDISDLDNQTISYVSGTRVTIPVSDGNPLQTTVGGYTYTGAFIGQDITNGYVLNNDGSAFEPATSVVPFRTYISKAPQPAPKRIHIGYQQEGASPEKDMLHNLYIRGGKGAIHIESTLEVETKVTIHTLSGVLVKELYVLPGAKVNVPVQHQGVYIVNRRKVSVN